MDGAGGQMAEERGRMYLRGAEGFWKTPGKDSHPGAERVVPALRLLEATSEHHSKPGYVCTSVHGYVGDQLDEACPPVRAGLYMSV